MSFDIKKHIKWHALVFSIYSVVAVFIVFYGFSSYLGIFAMLAYACALGIHVLITLFDMIILSKNKEARLKGILVILAIAIIGFGLCWSPALFY